MREAYATPNGHDWQEIWMVPAVIAAVVVIFIFFFKDGSKANLTEGETDCGLAKSLIT